MKTLLTILLVAFVIFIVFGVVFIVIELIIAPEGEQTSDGYGPINVKK